MANYKPLAGGYLPHVRRETADRNNRKGENLADRMEDYNLRGGLADVSVNGVVRTRAESEAFKPLADKWERARGSTPRQTCKAAPLQEHSLVVGEKIDEAYTRKVAAPATLKVERVTRAQNPWRVRR